MSDVLGSSDADDEIVLDILHRLRRPRLFKNKRSFGRIRRFQFIKITVPTFHDS